MKKIITITEFADELIERIDKSKDIQCCKVEIKNLAKLAKQRMGTEKIEVNWKED